LAPWWWWRRFPTWSSGGERAGYLVVVVVRVIAAPVDEDLELVVATEQLPLAWSARRWYEEVVTVAAVRRTAAPNRCPGRRLKRSSGPLTLTAATT
jgi:hypothetical protein